ncbi:MAG TPA: CYTH and CHAD domain-containing protein [Acidimicrobiales bacterium]|nr:CYTH and CHAD domain-containing protein [Acidimicrobiales bacterium]
MGRTELVERETKFDVPAGFELPDLRGVVQRVERLPEQHLWTTYYDTADGRLWERGITLRHRAVGGGPEGGPPGTWTLKVPVGDGGPTLDRDELSWDGTAGVVPPGPAAVVRGLVRRREMVQRVQLATTRRRLALHAVGTVAAEIDDDVVSVVGGVRDGLRFRQLELELADGGEAVREGVAAELVQAGAAVSNVPKVAEALGLAPPAAPPAVDRRSSLGDVVRSSLCSSLDRLLDYDWRLRVSAPALGPHDVHQARVATRRLRSDLKTFGAVLDPIWVGHVRADLKWAGGTLGAVRDADVLAGHVDAAPADLREVLAGQRQAAAADVVAMLLSDRYLDLLDRLHAAADRPPFLGVAGTGAGDPAADVLPILVGDQWRALRRQVRKAGRRPSDHRLHRIRIKAKQLRYAAEMAAPVVGKPARRTASLAEDVQTVLGEHHDSVAAGAWLRQQAAQSGLSPAAAFDAGIVAAREEHHRRKLARRWATSWDALARTRNRRWLG